MILPAYATGVRRQPTVGRSMDGKRPCPGASEGILTIEARGNRECRSGKPPSCEYRCRGESMRPRLVAEVSATTTTPAL
jgi:hypothetical protein